ncbi:MAG: hypothetical protein HFF03_07145 [Oscillospiraceae bacterium]|jgi:predicted RNase H-like HicB family nuclease|nr:hypothetical protein [Oscillospiraceae bacterium]
MAKYGYPAVFHPNEDGSYTVIFPDLPGCITEGKDLDHALHMAQDALTVWGRYAVEAGEHIAPASDPQDIPLGENEFIHLLFLL